MKTLAIIGSGISGLTLANELQQRFSITVFEKSRGVSGRMATRKAEPFMFDHGAQYFTVRDPQLKQWLTRHIPEQVLSIWQPRLFNLSRDKRYEIFPADDWYIAMPSMTGLCKHLAEGLAIQLNTEIRQLQFIEGQWYLTDQSGIQHGPFDQLVSSAPCAQFTQLASQYIADSEFASVTMSGCFSLMIGDHNLQVTEFDAAKVKDSLISWIAVNSNKTQSHSAPSMIIHSSARWAEENFALPFQSVQKLMLDELKVLTTIDYSSAEHIQLHRWRYAQVEQPYSKPYYQHPSMPLAACGDWCLGPRVECAFLSGLKLSQALIDLSSKNDVNCIKNDI